MDGCISLSRKVREKPVAFVFTNEIRELVVPAVDLIGSNETPFAYVYPLIGTIHTLVREGIAVDDILGKDIASRLDAVVLAFRFEETLILLREEVQKAFPAGRGIIGQKFDTIDAGNGPDGIVLILELGILLCFDASLADCEFAAENLNEEVAVTASRFQETGIEPLRLRFYKVQHGIHLPGIGKYLPVSGHPFLGLDLGVHSALSSRTGDLFEKASADHEKRHGCSLSIPAALRSLSLNKSHPRQAQALTDLFGGLMKFLRFQVTE